MKQLLLPVLLLAFIPGHAQHFTLHGSIPSGMAVLQYTGPGGQLIKDSVLTTDGRFVFRDTLTEPVMATLNKASFFLEPTDMTIAIRGDDVQHPVVTGSKTQDDYMEYLRLHKPLFLELAPLQREYDSLSRVYRQQRTDSLKYQLAELHARFGPYSIRSAQIDYAFFSTHPQSNVTAVFLRLHFSDLPPDSLQLFYDRLGPVVQQSAAAKIISQQIARRKAGSPGNVGADFTATDLQGSAFSLSGLRGHYVLLDFWASWCVPCRASMPHVKALYDRYREKGLTIVGIADDDNNPVAWKNAVEKDSTTIWTNVLRGLDWAKMRQNQPSPGDINLKYGVTSLPTKILLDKNGVIVGRYDRGTEEEAEAMDKKIAEVMGG